LYFLVRKNNIANQICHVVGEKKKKMVQFYVWFHMLTKGTPMTYDYYESMSKVLHFFDVKNFQKTH
jgi:hypothetical protein